jgi:phosphatidate cytidylyltransferase
MEPPARRGRRPPESVRRARSTARRHGRSDLGRRVLAALPLIAIAIALVALGGAVFAAGLFVLGVICLRELFSMYERARPVVFGAVVGLAGLIAAALVGDGASVLLALVCAVPVVFLLGLVQPRGAGVAGMTIAIFGLVWIGLGVAHAVLLRETDHGGGIVVLVLVATFIGDTGAYLGGRTFGRRPLAPAISPNKTVEGLVIGMAAAVAAAWFTGLYQDWLSGTDALLLGAAVALAAPLGDLFESFVKREAGAKDSGRVFGAHGGALDRLDAAIFALVAGYYVWQVLAA